MKNLDIVIILNSGKGEQRFAEQILNHRKNSQDRLLWFFPKKRNAYDNEINYKVRTDKITFELNWKDEKPNYISPYPYFMIAPPTYDDWLNKPEYRLSDIAKPDNFVLFVDDYISTGRTIFQSVRELESIGYKKAKMYYYAHTLNIMSRHELRNSKSELLTTSEFHSVVNN